MAYDYWGLVLRLSASAVTWIALIAMFLLPLVEPHDFSFLIMFALLVLINFVLVLAVKNFSPEFFARSPYADLAASPQARQAPKLQGNQNIGFRLSPLSYPKVHDEELRAFVPEYVKVDVIGNDGVLFSGNVPRGVLKQLRQAITDSLEAKQSATPEPAGQAAPAISAAPKATVQIKIEPAAKPAAPKKKPKAKK
jgi:hypothetical protein